MPPTKLPEADLLVMFQTDPCRGTEDFHWALVPHVTGQSGSHKPTQTFVMLECINEDVVTDCGTDLVLQITFLERVEPSHTPRYPFNQQDSGAVVELTEKELASMIVDQMTDDTGTVLLKGVTLKALLYRDINLWQMITEGPDESLPTVYIDAHDSKAGVARPKKSRKPQRRPGHDFVGDCFDDEAPKRKAPKTSKAGRGCGSASVQPAPGGDVATTEAEVECVLRDAGLHIEDVWGTCGVMGMLDLVSPELKQELAQVALDEKEEEKHTMKQTQTLRVSMKALLSPIRT